MEVRFWAATDVGRTRDHNEDNFLVDKKLNLFIVADGMGGHAAGEVASSVAVREVRRVVVEGKQTLQDYDADECQENREAVLLLIERSIHAACSLVHKLAQENPERRGMGTTLSMMLVAGNRGFIGHVGDSRIYMSRGGQVHQLTEDHSLINELIKRGRLKPGDAFDSPYKNAVTRAVGVYESVDVDTFDFDLVSGDNFLLCSDGLSCYIDDDITQRYLDGYNIKEIPDRFIRLANDSGGKDNITAVVVRVRTTQEDDQRLRMDDVRLKIDTLRSIPLFKYLSYKGLVKVMNVSESRRFSAGDVIFQEDSRDEAFFVLLEGKVRLTKGGMKLADLGPGGHFGEMAMVDKAPRSATATALEPVRALVVQRQQFYDLMRLDPILAVKLMWSFIQVLNARLRMSNQELFSARETIESLRHAPNLGNVWAELPPLDPVVAAVASLPVDITDELIPGFLFVESEAAGTDPLLRAEGGDEEGSGAGDLDERPGLPVASRSAPTTPLKPIRVEPSVLVGGEDELNTLEMPPPPDVAEIYPLVQRTRPEEPARLPALSFEDEGE